MAHGFIDVRNRHGRQNKRQMDDGLPEQRFLVHVGCVDEGFEQVDRRDADDGRG